MARMLASIVTIVFACFAAPAAEAAVRHASPDGTTTAACTAAGPCALQTAVNSAADGDEVVIAPGTYSLAKKLVPRGALDIHGDPNFASPRIVATGALKEPVLTLDGGTLTHVFIHAATNKEALVLKAGVVDGAWLESANGDAATVYGSDRTLIRNSVVKSMGAVDSAALWLRDGSGADSVEIRNVTALATAGTANGIHCDLTNGGATIVNSIARGTGYDLDFMPACSVAYSNFRPGSSTGVTAGTGNQSAEPVFADGDYRPAAGSPTIDAGQLDTRDASTDPDGRPRMVGAAPDIGAYEYAPPPPVDTGSTAEPELPDGLKGVPLPKQGRSMVVAAARGTVRVRVPGSDRFVALDEAGRVPVGSLIDARHGRVQLATAVEGGVQAGLFWGSKFKTGQSRRGNGMTTLSLRGGTLCPSATLAVASRKTKRKRRRGLWSRDHGGLYRTRGNDSVATVRGTRWLTKDRCNGTLTRVKSGVVSVHDLRRHTRVVVKAGHAYFARSR